MTFRQLYHLFPCAISDDDIENIKAEARGITAQSGTVFSTADDTHTLRQSTIKWLDQSWIQDLIWPFVKTANETSFGVDVVKQADMQYTIYEASNHGHYDWHHDVHWSSQDQMDRKLSVTLQLSDPASYQGGLFEFDEVKTNADFSPKGSLLVFPSYLSHKVHPLTSGQRHSLVAWFFGPRWR